VSRTCGKLLGMMSSLGLAVGVVEGVYRRLFGYHGMRAWMELKLRFFIRAGTLGVGVLPVVLQCGTNVRTGGFLVVVGCSPPCGLI